VPANRVRQLKHLVDVLLAASKNGQRKAVKRKAAPAKRGRRHQLSYR